jgi:hypothetical protein
VLIGIVLLYLAITEGLAAWASPKEPRAVDDAPADDTVDASSEDEPPDAA